jgi:PTS system mannitol-specific IIA component
MSDTDTAAGVADLIAPAAVRLGVAAADRTEAIRRAGEALVDVGAVGRSYVTSMLEREESVSTYVGEGVAIPHGTLAGKAAVHRDALSFVRFDPPVDWGGLGEVRVAVGIAAKDGRQVEVLAELASVLLDPERARRLRAAGSAEEVVALLRPGPQDGPDTEEGTP